MNLNCSLLVHTFNRYEWLWDGFLAGAHENLPSGLPKYFGTDISGGHGEHDFRDFNIIYSGHGEWSDRLRVLVKQVPTDYILYIQEDMWPYRPVLPLAPMMEIMKNLQLSRLQIAPVNQFYQLQGGSIPLFFHHKSKYLVSHQPSIWKKDFLLEHCLKPGENPWVNEYEGTKRLNNEPAILKKIAIYPHDWFKHKCEKGVFLA